LAGVGIEPGRGACGGWGSGGYGQAMTEQVFPCEWCALPVHAGSHATRLQGRHVQLNGALDPVVVRGELAWFHRRCALEARRTGEWMVAPKDA
jgi:hypothetical protein